jgi:hypothetical protein
MVDAVSDLITRVIRREALAKIGYILIAIAALHAARHFVKKRVALESGVRACAFDSFA